MKTIEQQDASVDTWGMVLLISFFTITWLSLDTEALPHLLLHLKTQWVHLTNWATSGMMNPHRTQW